MTFVIEKVINIMEKGESTPIHAIPGVLTHFLPFPQCFQPFKYKLNLLSPEFDNLNEMTLINIVGSG